MQELIRLALLLLVGLFVLFSVVQCRSVFTEAGDRQKRSINSYMNLCMFRKSRLCDYLHEMNIEQADQAGNEQEPWKRGVSQFYSNW